MEDQYSRILNTEEEKLAAMIDTLSSVIINEYNKGLYIRTFIYTRAELSSLLKAIALVKNPEIIEFDCGHEYNGQSIISSIFPELHVARWEYYSQLPNVKGYVIRTDRYKNATTIGNPAEINLYALKKASENRTGFSMEEVYDEFISENYGPQCVQYLKPAFKLAPDIILSSLYTLGRP